MAVLINRVGEENFEIDEQGVKIYRGLEFDKGLEISRNGRKEKRTGCHKA